MYSGFLFISSNHHALQLIIVYPRLESCPLWGRISRTNAHDHYISAIRHVSSILINCVSNNHRDLRVWRIHWAGYEVDLPSRASVDRKLPCIVAIIPNVKRGIWVPNGIGNDTLQLYPHIFKTICFAGVEDVEVIFFSCDTHASLAGRPDTRLQITNNRLWYQAIFQSFSCRALISPHFILSHEDHES